MAGVGGLARLFANRAVHLLYDHIGMNMSTFVARPMTDLGLVVSRVSNDAVEDPKKTSFS